MSRIKPDWYAVVERILHRVELTGCSQTDAIDAELPGLPDAERALWSGRVRTAVFKRRQAGDGAKLPQPERGVPVSGPAPQPASVRYGTSNRAEVSDDHHAVDLERIPSLRRQLSQAERVVDAVIAAEQWRLYPQVDKRRFDVAAELEREMERVRQVVSLDPLPGAIMEFLESHREMVARGADLERRRRERAGSS